MKENMLSKSSLHAGIKKATVGILLGSSLAMQATSVFSEDIDEISLLDLEEIIVTGTAGSTVTKLESSIAISSMNNDDIARLQPMSAADLLEVIPGFFTEDSAGESHANFSARGTWGDSNRMIGMHNDGVAVAYSDIFTGSMIKSDLMTERVEVVRGGTAGIISPRGPTAMVNFISRKGTHEPEGMVRQSISDYNMLRTDAYYSGPLTEDWVFAAGGFYRTQDGVRDRGFKADVGGQFRFNMTRELEDGELTLSLHVVDDHNAFYLPTPMTDKSDPDGIPGGIDALTGTLASADVKNVNLRSPNGMVRYDLQDGFHTKANTFGVDLTKGIGDSGWTVKNQFKYMSYKGDGHAIYPNGDGQIQLASDRLNALASDSGLDLFGYFPTATSLAYAYADTGEIINNPDDINGNGLTNQLTYRNFGYHMDQFVNNLNLTYESEKNTFTIGSVIIDAVYDKLYRNQHKYLAELTDDARRLDVVALDANDDIVGYYTSNGFTNFFTEATDASVDLRSVSLYLMDEYQVNDKLRVDFGVRYEELEADTVGRTVSNNVAIADTLNDPLVYSDDTVGAWADGGQFAMTPRKESDFGWSVGFNYKLSDNIAIYSHYTDTFMFRSDLLGEAINASRGNDVTEAQEQAKSELEFFEIGMRYNGDNLGASVTLYTTEFTQSANLTIDDQLVEITFGTESVGIEYEATWQPTDWMTLDLSGVIQDAKYDGIVGGVDATGNQVNRVANEQIRITPTFHIGDADVFMTYHYMGDRYGNAANTSELPAYSTLSAGFEYQFSDAISFMLKGTNLTNQVGLSEGNPRDLSQLTGGEIDTNFYARSIFGRTITGSVSIAF